MRVVIAHGLADELIAIDDSRQLAASGTPEWVRLVELDDGHRLRSLVESGRLATLVRDAAGRD